MIVESDGFRWVIDEDGVDGRLGPENHEAELLPFLEGDGGIFYDIGADVGRWTIRVAHSYAKVYAFEPHIGRRNRLMQNLDLNGIENVTVLAMAASDAVAVDVIGGMGKLGQGETLASLVPVDNLNILDPDMVKIDTEGHEGAALHGMRRIVERKHPKFLIELHGHLYGEELDTAVFDFFDSHDYEWRIVAKINSQSYVVAE